MRRLAVDAGAEGDRRGQGGAGGAPPPRCGRRLLTRGCVRPRLSSSCSFRKLSSMLSHLRHLPRTTPLEVTRSRALSWTGRSRSGWLDFALQCMSSASSARVCRRIARNRTKCEVARGGAPAPPRRPQRRSARTAAGASSQTASRSLLTFSGFRKRRCAPGPCRKSICERSAPGKALTTWFSSSLAPLFRSSSRRSASPSAVQNVERRLR